MSNPCWRPRLCLLVAALAGGAYAEDRERIGETADGRVWYRLPPEGTAPFEYPGFDLASEAGGVLVKARIEYHPDDLPPRSGINSEGRVQRHVRSADGTDIFTDNWGVFAYLGDGVWTYRTLYQLDPRQAYPYVLHVVHPCGLGSLLFEPAAADGRKVLWDSSSRTLRVVEASPRVHGWQFRLSESLYACISEAGALTLERVATDEAVADAVRALDSDVFEEREEATRFLATCPGSLASWIERFSPELSGEQRRRVDSALEGGRALETAWPLVQRPTGELLLVSTESTDALHVVEGSGEIRRLTRPANVPSHLGSSFEPVATHLAPDGSLYWIPKQGARLLCRWRADRVVTLEPPGQCALVAGKGEELTLERDGHRLTVPCAEVERAFDRPIAVVSVEVPSGHHGLDGAGRMRALRPDHEPEFGTGRHQRVRWTFHTHHDGAWRSEPGSPVYTSVTDCGMHVCRHAEERELRDGEIPIPEPPPAEGGREAEGRWEAEGPGGVRWRMGPDGLSRIEAGVVTGHWLLDLPAVIPILVDAGGDVWLAGGEKLHRLLLDAPGGG